MLNNSQRDPRWGTQKLGFSDGLIKDYGCTITCIADKFDLTPDVVNDRLKAVNGFQGGNLVIWKKVEEALPGVKFNWKFGAYDNEKVKANIPCIVEVNGAAIGGDRHWVLFIGNQRMYDPWDGQEKPTNTYGMPLSFVVLEGEVDKNALAAIGGENTYKGLDLTNKDSMKVAVDVWDRVKNGEFIEKAKYEADMQKLINDKNKEIVKNSGVLTQDEAKKMREEIQGVMKAAGLISTWCERATFTLAGKKPDPVVETPPTTNIVTPTNSGIAWILNLFDSLKGRG